MKLILLAATAALALPAIGQAQMAPGQTTPTTASPDSAATPPADGSMAPAQTAPAGSDPSMAPQGGQQGQQPMTTGTPAGGYQPSGPAMQGTMTPGTQPTYQPAPSPSQAYPAPAAKDSYPVCKKGQYDGCTERENAAGQGVHRHRRHK